MLRQGFDRQTVVFFVYFHDLEESGDGSPNCVTDAHASKNKSVDKRMERSNLVLMGDTFHICNFTTKKKLLERVLLI